MKKNNLKLLIIFLSISILDSCTTISIAPKTTSNRANFLKIIYSEQYTQLEKEINRRNFKYVDKNGEDLLTLSCRYLDKDLILKVLANTYRSDTLNNFNPKTGSNPLFEVVNKNPRKIEGVGIDSDLLKILLTLGGDIHIRDKNKNTLLMKALENISYIDTIEYLINKSSNVNAQNDKGLYPINFALSYDLKISKLLIQNGARLNIKDYEGNNPLMLASENGSLETIKFLVSKGFKINDKNNLGQTALNFAVRGSNRAVIEYLINNGADATNSHLKYDLIYTSNTSFRNVLFENIDLLIKGGFDINEVDKDGNNLLIKTNSKNISTSFLDYIITKGFDINHKNNFGENILFSELKKEDINSEVIIFLLNKNIDINNKNKNAFELFIESESTNEEILLKFLNKNNRPFQSEYRYLFHKKIDFLDTVLKNIDLGYYLKDIKFINSLFNYLVANKIKNNLINTLISKGFDLNTKNSDGDTLLIKSILDNNPNLFNRLILSGADINIKNINNLTPLNLSIIYRKEDIAENLIYKEGYKDNLQKNIDLATEEKLGNILNLLRKIQINE